MNRSFILRTGLPLAAIAIAATACSDGQKRALGEQDVRDSLRASVEEVVTARGTSVDGDGLDCSASIAADGAVDGHCAGTTAAGEAVAVAYRGTADVDAETCTAVMTVTFAGAAQPAADGVDCFAGG
jgi:hypothetical protein